MCPGKGFLIVVVLFAEEGRNDSGVTADRNDLLGKELMVRVKREGNI